MSSQVPAVLTTLVTKFGTVITGTRGAFGPRLLVDGPAPEAEDARDVVYVGYAGDPTDLTSVTWDEDWRGLGARNRDQVIAVRCAVVCWSGDDRLPALRAAAFTTYGLIEAATRADPGLGLATPCVAAVTAATLIQEAGVRVRLPFVVTVKIRS